MLGHKRILGRLAGAVALIAGLSMPGAAAATAASTQTPDVSPIGPQQNEGATSCMRAQPVDTYPGYAMVQAQCNSSEDPGGDPYQHWAYGSFVDLSGRGKGPYTVQLYNYGADACLYAPPAQARNGGGPFLEPCNANDLSQMWRYDGVARVEPPVPNGDKEGVVYQNALTGTCIDADGTYGGRAGTGSGSGAARPMAATLSRYGAYLLDQVYTALSEPPA